MSGTLMPGHAPLKDHPFAEVFPLLSDHELAELANNIAAHGQVETIKLHRGMILDGRNRYRACALKRLPVRSEVFVGTDDAAFDFVISKNIHRRHLEKGQRAHALIRYEQYRHGGNRRAVTVQDANLHLEGFAPPASVTPETRAELAGKGQVSPRLLASAAVVRDHGTPELNDAVREGKIALSTAAEIAEALPPQDQTALLDALPRDDNGKLTPEAKREVRKVAKEVRSEDQVEKKKKRDEKEKQLGANIRALPDIKAGLILSDFEWHFKVRSEATGMDRHAANHYVTAREASTPEAIVERQRERMGIAAPDCIHLMWVPACFSAIGHKVMELQGFSYVSQFVWIKPGMGTGFWVRDCHELLFIGVKGKIPAPNMGEQFKSAIEAPKGEHSEKPDFQYDIAETYFPSLPKIEFNARRPRDGWIQWGNEAPEVEQAALSLGIEQSEAAE